MDFKTDKPIFRQIVDLCYARILSGEWLPGQKIPSVREVAVELSVNTRTVLSAFDLLQASEIIAPKRGMGFYLADDAVERVRSELKKEFFDSTLIETFCRMEQLGITMEEVVQCYTAWSVSSPSSALIEKILINK
ncbi:MAG: GntR family transcriptional regulator [Bacteroidales bacterium]|nr:GntR family transcriptional regulator [Bacteroidales bacterium]